MTNISWFYPEQEKGWALGLNAAGGNIGVAVVQAPFVVCAVITAGAGIHLGARRADVDPAGAARRVLRLAVHGQPDRREDRLRLQRRRARKRRTPG